MAQRRSRTPNIDPRSQSRERALTLLYEADTKNVSGHTVIAGLVEPPDAVSLLIVRGVADNQEAIDALISEHADGWTMNRMPAWIEIFCVWRRLSYYIVSIFPKL